MNGPSCPNVRCFNQHMHTHTHAHTPSLSSLHTPRKKVQHTKGLYLQHTKGLFLLQTKATRSNLPADHTSVGPVVPSFRALSGRLKCTFRRHKFNKRFSLFLPNILCVDEQIDTTYSSRQRAGRCDCGPVTCALPIRHVTSGVAVTAGRSLVRCDCAPVTL